MVIAHEVVHQILAMVTDPDVYAMWTVTELETKVENYVNKIRAIKHIDLNVTPECNHGQVFWKSEP